MLFANSIICSSVIIEKKVFDKVYGFPEEPKFKAIEDYALWLRILTLSNFAYIDEPLLNYTDDVVNSIRGVQALDNLYEIRLLVLENYINWSEKAKINLSFLKKAKFHFWYYSKNKQEKLANTLNLLKEIKLQRFKKLSNTINPLTKINYSKDWIKHSLRLTDKSLNFILNQEPTEKWN